MVLLAFLHGIVCNLNVLTACVHYSIRRMGKASFPGTGIRLSCGACPEGGTVWYTRTRQVNPDGFKKPARNADDHRGAHHRPYKLQRASGGGFCLTRYHGMLFISLTISTSVCVTAAYTRSNFCKPEVSLAFAITHVLYRIRVYRKQSARTVSFLLRVFALCFSAIL